jgi:uncharacterized protein YndB with AHSA1/START domain
MDHQPNHEINFALDIEINATPDRVWRALTAETEQWWVSSTADSLRLTLEPRPGGRLFRDLGQDAGHLWAFVQVIKPPKLLELVGPMFTSLAINHHVAFRLEPKADATIVKYSHRAFGPIPPEFGQRVAQGTRDHVLKGLKNHVER